MKFFIVAVDHGWQLVPHGVETPESEAAKTRFRDLLVQTINARGVDLICEESDPCRLSIAQEIAYEHNPRIAWKNIIMSAEERLEAGIWEALLHRPAHTIEEAEWFYRTVDHRIAEDSIREEFFAKTVLETVNKTNAKSILILCGDMHMDFLKDILEGRGKQVETNRELIAKKYWE